MRRAFSRTLAVFLFSSLPAMAAFAQGQYRAFGHGNSSCKALMAHAVDAREAEAWVLGFLSGMNVTNEANHNVGATLTSDQMFAEVLVACERAPPDAAIADVAQALYFRAVRDGK